MPFMAKRIPSTKSNDFMLLVLAIVVTLFDNQKEGPSEVFKSLLEVQITSDQQIKRINKALSSRRIKINVLYN
jgi:hypothetical protein